MSSTPAEKRVTRAIVLAGGRGTRQFPFSKVVPKEMLPLDGVPAVQLVVEECLAGGFEEITIVTRPGNDVIRDHFCARPGASGPRAARDPALRSTAVERLRFVPMPATLGYGTGDALIHLAPELGGAPFAVLFADDVVLGASPAIAEVAEARLAAGAAAGIAMAEMAPEAIAGRFGNLALGNRLREAPLVAEVTGLRQRPTAAQIRSPFAVVSRAVLTAEIFSELARDDGGCDLGEAIGRLARRRRVVGVELTGDWHTVGDPASYCAAVLAAERQRRLSESTEEPR